MAWGLRGKSLLALAAACLLALLLAGAIGWRAFDSLRSHLGAEYTRNLTLLNRSRIMAPVSRELALSVRLADSQAVRQWLLDEGNAGKRDLALREAEGFRRDFKDQSYFLVSALSRNYYFNDAKGPPSTAPRYRLKADDAHDAWFFNTMKAGHAFNINVDPDVKLKVTKIWFNVIVQDQGRHLGLAGTGLDLSAFLRDFIGSAAPGVTPLIVDAKGAIQAHPDETLIAYNSGTQDASVDKSLWGLLATDQNRATARAALAAAAEHPGSATLFPATMQDKEVLLAVSYIPELKWHILMAVDLAAAQLMEFKLVVPLLAAGLALLAVAGVGFVYAVNRLVLRPLLALKQSAQAMAAGDYAVSLPPAQDDEIGELTAAFRAMTDKVRRHTAELEDMVQERTRELVAANREMASAHQKINDSIAYASLIQRAILPDRLLAAALGEKHFVLWRPRDIVGGDFYVYRELPDGCLLGVIDCAGHGVPGAFMTMLARAAIDQAMDESGAADPAGILSRTDRAIRAMLHMEDKRADIVTNMDAGLAYVDYAARRVIFAGAKIALYWCGGAEVGVLKGERRSLGDRKAGDYRNASVELSPRRTFYLTTDGFLDQAGGDKGYGFGNARFAATLREHAALPLAQQRQAFDATLRHYQGSHPQRDDITIVCFRFE